MLQSMASQKVRYNYKQVYTVEWEATFPSSRKFYSFPKRRIITINILLCILSHKSRWVCVCVCVCVYICIHMCDFIYHIQIYITFPTEGIILRYFSMTYFIQVTDYCVYVSWCRHINLLHYFDCSMVLQNRGTL